MVQSAIIENVSILGLRQTARWTPGTGRRTVGALLIVSAVAAHSAASWAWSEQGSALLAPELRALLLGVVAFAAAVYLVAFRPWAELTPAGSLVVQNPLRRHHLPLDQVTRAHRDAAGLHLRLADGRRVIVFALHDALSVADVARRDPHLAALLGHGASRDTLDYLAERPVRTLVVRPQVASHAAAAADEDRAIA